MPDTEHIDQVTALLTDRVVIDLIGQGVDYYRHRSRRSPLTMESDREKAFKGTQIIRAIKIARGEVVPNGQ